MAREKPTIAPKKTITNTTPEVYERLNPMRYEDARTMEVELGIALRAKGWGVWQG